MKPIEILILSDGKYGDRAAKVIQKKFPSTTMVTLDERDPQEFIDEVLLEERVEIAINRADLIIIYIRHPDVVQEICDRNKPSILAIDFGEGFLRQVKEINSKVVMPTAMCSFFPDTGIKEIDNYFKQYGFPQFEVELVNSSKNIPKIKDIKLSVESPCGASNIGIDKIRGKLLTPETITLFGLNIRYECREPVSILLSHKDMADSSALLHVLNLLDAIERTAPKLFLKGTPLGDYAAKRREEYRCPTKTSDIFREVSTA